MQILELPALHDLICRVNRAQGVPPFQGTLLALDPGETTGASVFEHSGSGSSGGTRLIHAAQLNTWPLENCVDQLTNIIREHSPRFLVFESYHIYSWRLDEHKFNEVPTIQIIGSLKTLAIQRSIPYHAQTAQVGKGFVSDEKLKRWNLWDAGSTHARDSMRHGCHYLLFGNKKPNSLERLQPIAP